MTVLARRLADDATSPQAPALLYHLMLSIDLAVGGHGGAGGRMCTSPSQVPSSVAGSRCGHEVHTPAGLAFARRGTTARAAWSRDRGIRAISG